MRVHVVGAGNVGGSIIRATVQAGHEVTVGVRNPDKIKELLEETGVEVSHSAEGVDVVISTLPHDAAAGLLPGFGLAGKVVIDASNPLSWEGGPVHTPPEGHTFLPRPLRFYKRLLSSYCYIGFIAPILSLIPKNSLTLQQVWPKYYSKPQERY